MLTMMSRLARSKAPRVTPLPSPARGEGMSRSNETLASLLAEAAAGHLRRAEVRGVAVHHYAVDVPRRVPGNQPLEDVASNQLGGAIQRVPVAAAATAALVK